MSKYYRTLIQSVAPTPTGNVTFNVKKYFIDVDNAFVETFDSNLSGITVEIVGGESKLTGLDAVASFTLAQGTYTYKVYNMTAQLTTIQGELIVGATPENIECRLFECFYTPTQVQNMITNEDFIPVASATEFDYTKVSGTQTFGQGTIFQDTFTNIGLTGKYIQVRNIENAVGHTDNPTGSYTGNELFMFTTDVRFFRSPTNSANISDVRLVLTSKYITASSNIGGMFFRPACIIDNCRWYGEIESTGNTIGGLVEINDINCIITNSHAVGSIQGDRNVGIFAAGNNGIIRDCKSNGSAIGITGTSIGGFIGTTGGIEISGCIAENVSVQGGAGTGAQGVGGFTGLISGASTIVTKNKATGTVYSEWHTGGFAGIITGGFITKCEADCDVSGIGARVSGFVALHQTGGTISDCHAKGTVTGNVSFDLTGFTLTTRTNDNCYCAVAVSGTASNINPFGRGVSGGSASNCYYDENVSGIANSGLGIPQTTAQMQANISQGIDPNVCYYLWDNDIWDFTPTTEYPKLR